jgi:CubicO group peptidase (beta-lactamase class C family)
MGHTSGLSGWEQPITLEDLYDWPRSTGLLAAQEPWWKPGTASGYHALTLGHLVGEVIRRITGQRTGEFLAAEIAGPLRADFHIGLDPKDFHRVANVIPPAGLLVDVSKLDPNGLAVRTFSNPVADATASWTDGWRTADIGAGNGHGNARSVARLQGVVSHGGELDGVRLLSPATVDRIFEIQSDGVDLVLNVPIRFGLGYGLPLPALMPMLAGRRVCFWGGWGGSLVFNDVDRRVTVAYVMNEMGSDLLGKPSAMTCVGTALRLLG